MFFDFPIFVYFVLIAGEINLAFPGPYWRISLEPIKKPKRKKERNSFRRERDQSYRTDLRNKSIPAVFDDIPREIVSRSSLHAPCDFFFNPSILK